MNTITCTNCGEVIEIDKALEGQIEARVLAAERHKHEEELEKVKAEQAVTLAKERKTAEDFANKQLEGEKELLRKQAEADLELEKKKIAQDAANEQRKVSSEQESLIKTLRDDAESAKKDSKKFQEQLSKLVDELREERKAKEQAELEAKKMLSEGESKIREDTKKQADEEHRLKQLEMQKKLDDTQKALADAQRKAEQGSQQNQGEVLEIDLENGLRSEFPIDEISEVKKGQRGADITQVVKNQRLENCGILLWESKNASWQPSWVAKFKEDIRSAGANIGIIVSKELPEEYGDMKNIEGSVWVVKPKLALALATAMRAQILNVHTANTNSENKGEKMEVLYQFLTGPEFRHRIESIVENYGTLQDEIEKEKRSAQLRWSKQEKSIRAVIDNTIGIYGDLQGITGGAMSEIKQLESGE